MPASHVTKDFGACDVFSSRIFSDSLHFGNKKIIFKVLLGSTMYPRKLFVYLCLKTYVLLRMLICFIVYLLCTFVLLLRSCCDHKSSIWFWSCITCGLCKVRLKYCAVRFRVRSANWSRYFWRAGLQLPLSNPFLILNLSLCAIIITMHQWSIKTNILIA